MSAAPCWRYLAEPSWQHASAAAYAAYLSGYLANPHSVKVALNVRDRFVRIYPDLHAWFAAPLPERLGRLYGEQVPHATWKVSYLARSYLVFLALRGHVRFPWDWLIAVPRLNIWPQLDHAGIDLGLRALVEEAVQLGYDRLHATQALHWTLTRVFLHAGVANMMPLHDRQRVELLDAVLQFRTCPHVGQAFGSVARYDLAIRNYRSHLHLVHVVLYHRGQASTEPHRIMPTSADRTIRNPRMEAIVTRYLATRRLTDRPATIERFDLVLRQFVAWLADTYPQIESFAEVTRTHVLAFAEALDSMCAGRTGLPFAASSKLRRLSGLSVFFREIAAWGWEDVPNHPLLGPGDLPKQGLTPPGTCSHLN